MSKFELNTIDLNGDVRAILFNRGDLSQKNPKMGFVE